jgi:hypothetical protein
MYWRPTGEIRFLTGWFGLLRVQQEESRYVVLSQVGGGGSMSLETRWRRAPSGLTITRP